MELYRRGGDVLGERGARQPRRLARGESVIKMPYSLDVLRDAYDHSSYCTRSDEYRHLMTDPPRANAASMLAPPSGSAQHQSPATPTRCAALHTHGASHRLRGTAAPQSWSRLRTT